MDLYKICYNSKIIKERWNVEYVKRIPHQKNGYDCGMYLIIYIETLLEENIKYIKDDFDITKSRYNLKKKLIYYV